MTDTKYRVVLKTTLKRVDGSLFMNGAKFFGTIHELPVEIRNAVEAKKDYLDIFEIPIEEDIKEVPEASKLPEIKEPDVIEGKGTVEAKESIPDAIPAKLDKKKPVRKRALKPKKA